MRLILFGLTIVGLLVFWWIATDMLYCLLAFRFDMIDWPFTVWLSDYSSRNYNAIVRLRWWGSLILPGCAIAKFSWDMRAKLWPSFVGLYGKSRWATWREMRRQGITHSRHPF